MKIKFILVCFSLTKTVISSYILYPDKVNFTKAVQKCDSINATVVLPKNKTEDDFIRDSYLNNASVTTGIWLAIYDFIGNETNVNYYTNQKLAYTYWNSGDPNEGPGYCVRYDKDYKKWADHPCDQIYSVLCEIGTIELSSTIYTGDTVDTTYLSGTFKKTDTSIMNIPASSTIHQTTLFQTPTITTTQTIISVSNKMNIPLWNKWNPWSFCQLHRQRNILNRIEYQILNVSCSLICKYNY
jgi:hypothetical protein